MKTFSAKTQEGKTVKFSVLGKGYGLELFSVALKVAIAQGWTTVRLCPF